MRVGAIDVGSNSIRLLVADVEPTGNGGVIVSVARAGEICRLGRGLHRTGVIEPELAVRAASLVREFQRRALALGAARVVVGATAALRSAVNGAEVAALIREHTGIEVRVLTGDEEAQLVYRAVVAGLGSAARRSQCIVFDLGGGSTEVVSGVGDRAGRWVSLPFGAVSLTERHLHHDPVTPGEVAALEAAVDQTIMHSCAYLPSVSPLLAGVGGTITVLAALDRGMTHYDPVALEGWTIPAERLAQLVERFVRSTHGERREWPVLGEGRADIVVAGVLVVRRLLARFPAPGLTCSTQGLRYGLALLAATEATGPGAPAQGV